MAHDMTALRSTVTAVALAAAALAFAPGASAALPAWKPDPLADFPWAGARLKAWAPAAADRDKRAAELVKLRQAGDAAYSAAYAALAAGKRDDALASFLQADAAYTGALELAPKLADTAGRKPAAADLTARLQRVRAEPAFADTRSAVAAADRAFSVGQFAEAEAAYSDAARTLAAIAALPQARRDALVAAASTRVTVARRARLLTEADTAFRDGSAAEAAGDTAHAAGIYRAAVERLRESAAVGGLGLAGDALAARLAAADAVLMGSRAASARDALNAAFARGDMPAAVTLNRDLLAADPSDSLGREYRWRFRDLLIERPDPFSIIRIGAGLTAFDVKGNGFETAATLPAFRVDFAAGHVGFLGARFEIGLQAIGRSDGASSGALSIPALRFPSGFWAEWRLGTIDLRRDVLVGTFPAQIPFAVEWQRGPAAGWEFGGPAVRFGASVEFAGLTAENQITGGRTHSSMLLGELSAEWRDPTGAGALGLALSRDLLPDRRGTGAVSLGYRWRF